jgi:hypothetical protein
VRRLDSNLNGGPNPQGVSVGIETTARVQHGFTLTAAGVFTAFDPPGHIDFPQFHQPGGGDRGSIPRGNAGKLLMHPTLLMTIALIRSNQRRAPIHYSKSLTCKESLVVETTRCFGPVGHTVR